MYSHIRLDVIEGQTIHAAWMHEGDMYLVTNKDIYKLEPEGDCCARCYINGVDASELLLGATVTEVEDLETERLDTDDDYDVVDTFGHRIHTTKGICTIDMRTEHNGYYSGRIVVYSNATVPKDAKPLTDFEG